MAEIKKITYTDNLRQGTDKINSNFDTMVDEIKAVDDRVDNIIVGGGPDKDPELVDIRNLDPSYTPQREINVAGDVTRDMQAQLTSNKNELEDVRTVDPSYTPQREINVAGDVTRDMQAQFAAHKAETTQSEYLKINIPSDYPTLQEAVDALSLKKPKLNVVIDLNIESGHVISQGLVVIGGDYSHFRIVSDDPVVKANVTGHLIYGEYAQMPVLACLIDMENKGEDGYHVFASSTGKIEAGCGIMNAPLRCAYVNRSSRLTADGAILTGAGDSGLWCTRGSTASIDGANLSGAVRGVQSRRSSLVNAQYATINNCAQAIVASRATVNAVSVTIDGTTDTASAAVVAEQGGVCIVSTGEGETLIKNTAGIALLAVSGGRISATSIIIEEPGLDAIHATSGGEVIANSATIINPGRDGIYAEDGGAVFARGIKITGATGRGVSLRRGARFSGYLAEITGSQLQGVLSYDSIVSLQGAKIINSVGRGVDLMQGSKCDLTNSTVTGNAIHDIRVLGGSICNANGCTTTNGEGSPGLSNVNVSEFNAISSNNGIIWT